MSISTISQAQAVSPLRANLLSVLVSLILLPAGTVSAGTWVGGSGIWDQVNGAPWGGTAPVAGEAINLTQSGGPFTITYLAGTDATTPVYGVLNLGNATGTSTLSVGSNGGTAGEETLLTGNFFVNSGGRVALNAGGTIGPGPLFASFYVAGGGEVSHTGGTWTTNQGDLTLNPASGIAKYTVNGPTAVLTPRNIIIGRQQHGGDVAGTAIFDMMAAQTVSSVITVVGNNAGGPGTLNITGGTYAVTGSTTVNNTGTINLSAGTITHPNVAMNGTFVQSSGTNTVTFGLNVGSTVGSTGNFTMNGGTITARDLHLGSTWPGFGSVVLGGSGTFTHNGGTVTVNGTTPGGLHVSHAAAVVPSLYNLRGATVAGSNRFTVETLGTFQGWGNVTMTGPFTNNGQIIADGEGTDRSLSILNHGTLATAENTTDKGWFAVNQGKLTLRGVNLAATTNWGEQAGDAQIDLVNSAQLTYSNLSGTGTLNGSLLAVDRTDVPAPPADAMFISVHEFSQTGSATFSSFDLAIRFDEQLMPSDPSWIPALFHNDGSGWEMLSSTIDHANSLIYVEGLTSYGLFAVGATYVPEPSSFLMLGLGALGLVRQARRRRTPRA